MESNQSSSDSDELNYCDDSDDGEMNVNNEISSILNIAVEEELNVINHRGKCLKDIRTIR